MWLTHVDLRSRCTLRKIPFDRIVSIDVCAGATIKISLIVDLQAIVQHPADLEKEKTNAHPG